MRLATPPLYVSKRSAASARRIDSLRTVHVSSHEWEQQKCDLDLADLLAIYSYLEVFYPLWASKNTEHRRPKCSSRGFLKCH